MYVAQNLLYVEMHKTGSTHIVDLLERTIPGRRMGKHNRPQTYPADRLILTSIRNPWDWYLSLWTFGCRGRGALHGRLVHRGVHDADCPAAGLSREDWRALYGDARDPDRFRSWLRAVHDAANAGTLGEGYGDCPFHGQIGLYTFRFLTFALDDPRLLAQSGAIHEIYPRRRAIDLAIRAERLPADLLEALWEAGYTPDAASVELIRRSDERPTNASDRGSTKHFYDAETAGLVAEREGMLIEAFGYVPPDV